VFAMLADYIVLTMKKLTRASCRSRHPTRPYCLLSANCSYGSSIIHHSYGISGFFLAQFINSYCFQNEPAPSKGNRCTTDNCGPHEPSHFISAVSFHHCEPGPVCYSRMAE
jgi:hypothetical protein